ncbi:MAG: hypothetical protein MN733_42465 [Nitrososphaera sp.]|nr:hypothetical protein [Nitrososphaera sp.]
MPNVDKSPVDRDAATDCKDENSYNERPKIKFFAPTKRMSLIWRFVALANAIQQK